MRGLVAPQILRPHHEPAARIGPTVWLLGGPIPIVNNSKTLICMAGKLAELFPAAHNEFAPKHQSPKIPAPPRLST